MVKKFIATVLAITAICSTCCFSALAAADGVKIDFDEASAALGYTIKGYYGTSTENCTPVTGVQQEDGSLYFAGKQNNENYRIFYYDIFDKSGNKVVDKAVGYIGRLEFADPNKVIDISAPLSYDEQAAYVYAQSSNKDIEDYLAEEAKKPTTKPVTGTVEPTEQPVETQKPVEEPKVDETTVSKPVISGNSVFVTVTSDYDISAIMSDIGVAITVKSDSSKKTYNVNGLTLEFPLTETLEQGGYTVKYKTTTKAAKEITGTTKFSTGSDAAVLKLKVEPACLLSVLSDSNKSFNIVGVNKKYTTNNGVLAVTPGSEYTVLNLTDNLSYNISIPKNATKCELDLDSQNGSKFDTEQVPVIDTTPSTGNTVIPLLAVVIPMVGCIIYTKRRSGK